jgi:hypothetical protein
VRGAAADPRNRIWVQLFLNDAIIGQA